MLLDMELHPTHARARLHFHAEAQHRHMIVTQGFSRQDDVCGGPGQVRVDRADIMW